jgi:SAM-dependent methyltransferase
MRRSERLRSVYYLLLASLRALRASPRGARRGLDDRYRSGPDPWRYASDPEESRRHDVALELLERSRAPSAPDALEVGCGEGLFTERIADRCSSLLAVDVSRVALARAADRCARLDNVRVSEWDATRGEPLGRFGLVICMDVLCDIRRPLAQRRAVRMVARSVAPGGLLLVSAVIQDPIVERAAWARALGRGGRWVVDRLAREEGLVLREIRQTERHVVAALERA